MPLVLGLDVGTQGARAIVCTETGQIIAQGSSSFSSEVAVTGLPNGWFEQYPEVWWEAASQCLRSVVASIREHGRDPDEIAAIAVDSTSGTVLPVDAPGNPLRPAIMYNDSRAEAEARECNEAGSAFTAAIGYKFGSSFALPKLLWMKRNEPELWGRSARIIHAADCIVGRVTGEYGRSDNSNALKTGYDLIEDRWPDFISQDLGIEAEKLPSVSSPGEVIGRVSRGCSEATGLAEGTLVVGGISDGTAGFIASGASAVGEWNSTVGTTLVLRGVSEDIIRDPLGRIYCHKHPDGWWLPGGASNVGGECLSNVFPGEDYDALNRQAVNLIPSGLVCYPLVRHGERLPFINPRAEGFVCGESDGRARLYAGYLEGVAFVERWCYELMEELGAPVGDTVYATGGGAKSLEWMRIRASVLNRMLIRPAVTESAMGTAVVAASRTIYRSLMEASRKMVRRDLEVGPEPALVEAYDESYRAFRDECEARGLG